MKWFLVLAMACSQPAKAPPTGGTTPPPASGDRDSCATADDCTLVDQCCGCGGGGGRLAIRKDHVTAFEAQRKKECGDTVCAAVMSTDASCDADAICAGGTCSVAPHIQHQ